MQKHFFSSVISIEQKLCEDIGGNVKCGLPDKTQCLVWLADTGEQIAPGDLRFTAVQTESRGELFCVLQT